MELRACIQALEYIREEARSLGITRAIIFTDSQYIHDTHNAARSWRRSGWRNQHGRPVENRDLWRKLLSVRSKTPLRTDIQRNAGKSTPVLRKVDQLAKQAAKSPIKDNDIGTGYQPGKVSRARSIEAGAATLLPAKNQELIIKVYAHRLAGKEESRVSFHVFSEEEKKLAGKHCAYVTGASSHEIHGHHFYRVRFNDKPHYPIFEIVEILGSSSGSAKSRQTT